MTGDHRPKPAAFLLVPVAFAFILALFAWPNAEGGPRDLPVGVAGQPAQTRTIEQGLAARGEAFDIHRYVDEAAARAAIEDRDIYGAFVATPGGAKVLTALAASAPSRRSSATPPTRATPRSRTSPPPTRARAPSPPPCSPC